MTMQTRWRPAASGRAWAVILAASAGLAASVASAAPADNPFAVSWRSGAVDQPKMATRAELKTKLSRLVPVQGTSHILVRFDQIPTDAQRQSMEAKGLRLLNYVGGSAYFASLDRASLDAGALAADRSLLDAEVIQTQWKLHADLRRDVVHPWMVVDPGPEPAEGAPREEAIKRNPTVAVYVAFHKDVDLNKAAELIRNQYAGTVRSRLEPISTLVVELPQSQIKSLVEENDVQWVEPPLPRMSELNAENRATTGVNTLQSAPYNLNGAGVKVFIYDGGKVRATHQDLAGRVTFVPTDASSTSDHSTHVMGTVGGTGAASGGTERGMAPGVTFLSAGLEQEGGLQQGFLYTDPGDLLADYTYAINTFHADMSNNSIGTNTEPNGYPCEWQGQYGITDALIDSIARGRPDLDSGNSFTIFWAAGNERQGSRCDVEGFGDYFSVAPPSGAKNHISIGATDSWESESAAGPTADTMTTFSSWGPVDDGRLKPDVCAPGCQEGGGETGVRSAGSSSDTAYTVKCGTSMATPTATGIGALILQDFRAHFTDRPDPRASTMKVFLVHTAVDLGNPGPDYQFGYGRMRAQNAVDFVRTGNFTEGEVSQSSSSIKQVVVLPGDTEMRVTLAWDDAPGTANSAVNLVNDLDLIVTSPNGTRFYPWTLNPAAPSANAVQTVANHRDNLEQVLVNNPQPGTWTVEVAGTAVPQGPQTFSLAASPFLVDCSSRGTGVLNAAAYNCHSLVTMRVTDCDLNLNEEAIDTVQVSISSTTEPSPLTIVLQESGVNTATFVGSIQLATSPGGATLAVQDGDTITFNYVDSDDGKGGHNLVVSDTATVDCAGPIISDIVATNIRYNAADITFTTNELASGTTRWGTVCGSTTNVVNTSPTTSHSFAIAGLTPGTTYRFRVEAADLVGNTASNDNGGFCFSFTTPEIPNDYFTQLFTSGSDNNDLDFTSITLTPSNGINAYSACTTSITQLPVNPTNHRILAMGNDLPGVMIDLTGGAQVSVYGHSYSRFWINASGNITFDAEDTDTSESITDHFERDRISVLFDDIDAGAAGASVRFEQLEDRAVVSWINVPEDSPVGTNTFQCEMFFDGRIRLSYLAIATPDGLVGISGGQGVGQPNGTPANFNESNLNAYASCAGRAPVAATTKAYSPTIGQAVNVALLGTDDGQPVPASLVYIVESLPQYGTLSDSGHGVIQQSELPFVLSSSSVTYNPTATFAGQVSFSFRLSDGGLPPQGGQSNIAQAFVTVGPIEIIDEFLVDDANPGWTTSGLWAFGRPTGQGTTSRDPTAGFTGQNVLGYNLNGDYTSSMTVVQYITSNAIDCSNVRNTTLDFQRWLGIESSSYDHANVDVSNDGVNWVSLWTHNTGTTSAITSWTPVTYDISAVADNQPTVYIRWGMGTTDTSVVRCGWNIDDVRIKGVVEIVPPPSCAGDTNGDGLINSADLSVLLTNFGLPAAGPSFGDFNNDGQCNSADLSVLLAGFGTTCQ